MESSLKLLDVSVGQGRIIKSIATRLNIGLVIIVASVCLADVFVSDDINNCMISPDLRGVGCLDTNPLWVIISLIFILSVCVSIGATLVIQHMLLVKKPRLLLSAEFTSFTLYPSYTLYRVLTELRLCQPHGFPNSACLAYVNDVYKGPYVISLHTIILGIAFLIVFFYLHHKQ